MHEVLILAVKGVAGGTLVVAFALLSQGLEPKRFAGLFSAAPAVALAGLAVTLLDKGAHDAHQSAAGAGCGVGAERMDPGRGDRRRPAARGMNAGSDEATVRDRVEQRPAFSLGKIKQTTARELIIRFAAGGVVLAISTVVWAAAAVLGYVVLWWR